MKLSTITKITEAIEVPDDFDELIFSEGKLKIFRQKCDSIYN